MNLKLLKSGQNRIIDYEILGTVNNFYQISLKIK